MKTLKVALFSAVLFSTLAQANSTSLEVVKAYMAAWNEHNASKAAALLASDVTYYDAAAGEPVTGRKNAEKEVIGAFIKAVPDLKWTMTDKPVYDDDTVAFRWEFAGKNSGEWGGSPATHNAIKFEGVSYIRVKDGKITWQGDYYDSKKLDEELEPEKK